MNKEEYHWGSSTHDHHHDNILIIGSLQYLDLEQTNQKSQDSQNDQDNRYNQDNQEENDQDSQEQHNQKSQDSQEQHNQNQLNHHESKQHNQEQHKLDDAYFIDSHLFVYKPDAVERFDSTIPVPFDPCDHQTKAMIKLSEKLNRPLYYIQGHYRHQEFVLNSILQIHPTHPLENIPWPIQPFLSILYPETLVTQVPSLIEFPRNPSLIEFPRNASSIVTV